MTNQSKLYRYKDLSGTNRRPRDTAQLLKCVVELPSQFAHIIADESFSIANSGKLIFQKTVKF